ncbi:MAG TPA: adenine deaminase C-terminal domain-containing protein [Solirubrobacteraceae bacterium]|nr:adenine deaminase C-terminal domain-containing protein [Solirubrobacteraceae bacterium]
MSDRRALLDVALGRRPPDLAIVGATVADVYSGEWLPWNVEVAGGRIAYAGPRSPRTGPDTEWIAADGKVLAPGYIEPHFHPWEIYNPASVREVTLPAGTTTVVADDPGMGLPGGPAAFARLVEALRELPGHQYWAPRVPRETALGDHVSPADLDILRDQLSWPDVLAVGEMERWAPVAAGAPHMVASFEAARAAGKRVDGHTAGASFARLVALAGLGISADHEAIDADEAVDRLRLGMWTLLRGSSLRRDLPELARVITERRVDSRRLLMTTDGAGPAYMARNGVTDGLLATVVEHGVDPMTALQMVTVNPAMFLGIDEELGGISPGRRATMVLLEGRDRFTPEQVLVDGEVVARHGELVAPIPAVDWDALGCRATFADPAVFGDPRLYTATGSGDVRTVPVLRFESTAIARRDDRSLPVRDGVVQLTDAPDCAYAALVDREARWVSHAIVASLFTSLDGVATTYNTTGHVLVVGRDPASMAAAGSEAARLGGGIAVAAGGEVEWSAPLTIAGLSIDAPYAAAVAVDRELGTRARAGGYRFHDALYSLLFLSCDFLPDLRLTPQGILEVKSGAIVEPPVPGPLADR